MEVLRKKQRFLSVAIEDSVLEDDVEDKNNGSRIVLSKEGLLKHIQQLPDNYRMVFNLYVFEDCSHKTIADKLNVAIGTSKSLLSRAKSVLRSKINEELNKKVS